MKRFTKDTFKEIMERQLSINWYTETFKDLQKNGDWLNHYTTTEEKEEEYKARLRVFLKDYIYDNVIEKEIGRHILWYWFKVKKKWIYKTEDLVCKEWEPLMNAFIKNTDEYLKDNPDVKFNVSYIKDKYWRLRMEYSWWDDYLSNMIECVEDLSAYL